MTASAPDLLTSFYGKGIAPVSNPPCQDVRVQVLSAQAPYTSGRQLPKGLIQTHNLTGPPH